MLPFYLIIALSKPSSKYWMPNCWLPWVFNSKRQTLSLLDVNNNFFSNSQHDIKQHIAVKSQCCISVHFSAKFIALYFIKIGHFICLKDRVVQVYVPSISFSTHAFNFKMVHNARSRFFIMSTLSPQSLKSSTV